MSIEWPKSTNEGWDFITAHFQGLMKIEDDSVSISIANMTAMLREVYMSGFMEGQDMTDKVNLLKETEKAKAARP
jgi:hypothetical protein